MEENILTKLKIFIIGDMDVGKSSLFLRFTEDDFDPKRTSSMYGFNFNMRQVTIDGNIVNLLIWDSAGQDKFRNLIRHQCRDAHGLILAFDVSSYKSFDILSTWLKELDTDSIKNNGIKMIVGNKIDMENREVSRDEAMEFARKHQTLYYEVSAKTKDGVQAALEELVHKIIQTPGLWKPYKGDNIQVSENEQLPQSSSASYCSLA